MTQVFEFLFWLSLVWLGYVYLGYPTILWFFGLFKLFHPHTSDSYLPRVSVLISARNERNDIGWKIAETLAWNYPREQLELLVASDASDDGTDEILANVSDPRFQALRLEKRKGKNEALNRLNDLAKGELLFFTDANSHIEPDCLRKMVRHFADPRVGCVTGTECTIREGEDFVVTSGTRAFLGYESLVNILESRLGSVLVCDGSVFCIRKSLFRTLQPDLANDFELPVHIGSAGRRSYLNHLPSPTRRALVIHVRNFAENGGSSARERSATGGYGPICMACDGGNFSHGSSALAWHAASGTQPAVQRVACLKSVLCVSVWSPTSVLWTDINWMVVFRTKASRKPSNDLPVLFCHGQYRGVVRIPGCHVGQEI